MLLSPAYKPVLKYKVSRILTGLCLKK